MPAPIIAMGGIGGSGTRACAQILLNAGYHLGSDLNEALDNLTFSLIFKRQSALMWNRTTFECYLSAFLSHLQTGHLPKGMVGTLADIPAAGRAGHSADWLTERLGRARTPGPTPGGGTAGLEGAEYTHFHRKNYGIKRRYKIRAHCTRFQIHDGK